MRKIIWKLNKKIISVMMALVLLTTNTVTIMAQENKDSIVDEIRKKKEAGLEVYELVDENGDIKGYYEPYSDANPEPVTPRYRAGVNWTIPAKTANFGTNEFGLGAGSKIEVNISQSRTGISYIRLLNAKTYESIKLVITETNNGWYGTINFGPSSIPTAVYAFGIGNASDYSITYTGTYTL